MVRESKLYPISWKALTIALLLFLLPNFLLMKLEVAGSVTPEMALGTVLDLVIILPIVCYFFVFKKRPSFFVLIPISIAGLLVTNWIVPNHADDYLQVINKTVIAIEAALISLEILLMIVILKRIPVLKRTMKEKRKEYYHFLRSFIESSQEAYSFRFKKLNQYQNFLRFLSTDLAVFYYAFFSWRKKRRVVPLNSFTYHKNGEYLGVFIMIVHALAIEIIAVHFLIMQFSHLLAWIVTAFDIYALLFVIADYQAIRISPVILDEKGLHVQKGLRFHAVIPYEKIESMEVNQEEAKAIATNKAAFDLTLSGLVSQKAQYKLTLKEPILAYSVFGIRKNITSLYITVDEPKLFEESLHQKLKGC